MHRPYDWAYFQSFSTAPQRRRNPLAAAHWEFASDLARRKTLAKCPVRV
jgi:hypothetical protein